MPKVHITLDKPSHNMQQFQLQQIFVIRSLISLLLKILILKQPFLTNKSSHKTLERAV